MWLQLSRRCIQQNRFFSHGPTKSFKLNRFIKTFSKQYNKNLKKESSFIWVQENDDFYTPVLINKKYIIQMSFEHDEKNYTVLFETLDKIYKKSFDNALKRNQWVSEKFNL